MRLLTLPFRYWWVTLLVLIVTNWITHTGVNIGPKWEDNWGGPVSGNIKRTMLKLGPNYYYRTLHDGTFQINRYDGRWISIPMVNKLL